MHQRYREISAQIDSQPRWTRLQQKSKRGRVRQRGLIEMSRLRLQIREAPEIDWTILKRTQMSVQAQKVLAKASIGNYKEVWIMNTYTLLQAHLCCTLVSLNLLQMNYHRQHSSIQLYQQKPYLQILKQNQSLTSNSFRYTYSLKKRQRDTKTNNKFKLRLSSTIPGKWKKT